MERKKEQAASCTSISYNLHFFDTWKTDGHACIGCVLTSQLKSLATTLTPWHLGFGYFQQCRCRTSGQQSRLLSAVDLVLIGSFQPSLLSSSYMPRTIFPLPCITPGPGTGQLETTLIAQSLLKLFKPHNPNTAQTYLLCFTQSFLETPQHRLWTMPIPHPLLHPNSFCLRTHLTLPGRPAQSGSSSWKLQLPNISFKAVVSTSVIFTYLIRTHPSYILTQVHPPSSARREATCTSRKLSPHEDTHIL